MIGPRPPSRRTRKRMSRRVPRQTIQCQQGQRSKVKSRSKPNGNRHRNNQGRNNGRRSDPSHTHGLFRSGRHTPNQDTRNRTRANANRYDAREANIIKIGPTTATSLHTSQHSRLRYQTLPTRHRPRTRHRRPTRRFYQRRPPYHEHQLVARRNLRSLSTAPH